MGRVVIASPRLIESAGIVASNEAASMPASSLQLRPGLSLWRATSLASVNLVVNLTAPQAINLVALLYTNASATATWRIRAAASEAGLLSAPVYDSGVLSHWPEANLSDWPFTHAVKWIGTAQNLQWWRIDISDAANPDGFYQAGRLYISAAWQPSYNMSRGVTLGFIDPSEETPTQGGQSAIIELAARRTIQFTLNTIGEAEIFNNAFELDRQRGRKRDVLVIKDPDSAYLMKQTLCGKIDDLSPIVHAAFHSFGKSYRIIEMLP